jgi:hypothetical protein
MDRWMDGATKGHRKHRKLEDARTQRLASLEDLVYAFVVVYVLHAYGLHTPIDGRTLRYRCSR